MPHTTVMHLVYGLKIKSIVKIDINVRNPDSGSLKVEYVLKKPKFCVGSFQIPVPMPVPVFASILYETLERIETIKQKMQSFQEELDLLENC